VNLFQLGNKDALTLPEPIGQVQQLTEKLYVPVKDHPEVFYSPLFHSFSNRIEETILYVRFLFYSLTLSAAS
jgi:hypothetical protein